MVWMRAVRIHHAAKSLLIFVPLILAHRWSNWPLVFQTGIAFLALLALTSASYLVNDLLDIDADRQHATKRFRPIARGALSATSALVAPAVLVPAALALGFYLNPAVGGALLAYLVLTLAYSFGLKRVPLVDTLVIAVLFTTRIIIGSILVGPPLPVWLLAFSICFFFSLALAKRHTEITRAQSGGGDSLASRGYRVAHAPMTLGVGLLAGAASQVILILYLLDEAFRRVGYSRPIGLWVIVLLVAVWTGRIWFLAARGRMDDDPVSFALRDRWSIVIGAMISLFYLLAL